MASINEDLQEDPIFDKDSLPFEDRKDPTAYLFRRNFGTHLHILGLSEPEIEYVIGHDIDDPYETRNEFVNEEKLFSIKQKMDRRPLVNSDLTQIERIDAAIVAALAEAKAYADEQGEMELQDQLLRQAAATLDYQVSEKELEKEKKKHEHKD